MTKQYIWALAIVGAFVAGTILASTLYDNTAFAIHQPNHNPPGGDDDMGWKEAIDGQQQQIDDLKANEILGFYQLTLEDDTENPFLPITVQCDFGDIATGGGVAASSGVKLRSSVPINNISNEVSNGEIATGWKFFGKNTGEFVMISGAVYVLCADFAPAHVP